MGTRGGLIEKGCSSRAFATRLTTHVTLRCVRSLRAEHLRSRRFENSFTCLRSKKRTHTHCVSSSSIDTRAPHVCAHFSHSLSAGGTPKINHRRRRAASVCPEHKSVACVAFALTLILIAFSGDPCAVEQQHGTDCGLVCCANNDIIEHVPCPICEDYFAVHTPHEFPSVAVRSDD